MTDTRFFDWQGDEDDLNISLSNMYQYTRNWPTGVPAEDYGFFDWKAIEDTDMSDDDFEDFEDEEEEEESEWTPERLQEVWDTAIEKFPHALDATSYEQGYPPIDEEPDEDIEYSVEYTFQCGYLLDQPILAGGWIEIRFERGDDQPYINGWFGAALNGNWQDKGSKLLGEYGVIEAWYDLDTEEWSDLTIGSM